MKKNNTLLGIVGGLAFLAGCQSTQNQIYERAFMQLDKNYSGYVIVETKEEDERSLYVKPCETFSEFGWRKVGDWQYQERKHPFLKQVEDMSKKRESPKMNCEFPPLKKISLKN